MDFDQQLIEKAKRRVKRQIRTGKKQHRVYKITDKLYAYRVKTGQPFLQFRVDSLQRVRFLVDP